MLDDHSPQVMTKQLLKSTNRQERKETKSELSPLTVPLQSSGTKGKRQVHYNWPGIQQRQFYGEQRSRYEDQRSQGVLSQQQQKRLKVPSSLAKYISDIWKSSIH